MSVTRMGTLDQSSRSFPAISWKKCKTHSSIPRENLHTQENILRSRLADMKPEPSGNHTSADTVSE